MRQKKSTLGKSLFFRTSVAVPVLGVIGLAFGIAAAFFYSDQDQQYAANATLAMLPTQDISVVEAPNYWDVLNQGQATRSAAIVLGDRRWLDDAAVSAGVPKSDLVLTAGAMPETTLITVTMRAGSAEAAERALGSVLNEGVGLAASVSGPFRLEVVKPPQATARSLSPTPVQLVAALGIGGLLMGAGAGFAISRATRTSSVDEPNEKMKSGDSSGFKPRRMSETVTPRNGGIDHPTREIPLR